MSIDDLTYLWDGSDKGWTLHHYNRMEWAVTFRFGDNGPTFTEVSAMRDMLDDLRNEPVKSVWSKLRGKPTYSLPETLSNREMRWLVDKADRASLRTSVVPVDRSGYLPVSSNGSAMLIEDDRLAEEVAHRMIAAGVPVEEIHVD
jgi:hypothetical protein